MSPSPTPTQPITPRGDLDLAGAPALRLALQAREGLTSGPVEVDLTEVPFMDAAGLGVLAGAALRLQKQGRALRVTHPRASVARFMALTHTTDLLATTPANARS